jgi:hypothetical protein
MRESYSAKDVDLAVDCSCSMANPSLWDLSFAFDLFIIPGLEVDAMDRAGYRFSGLDFTVPISRRTIE